MNNLLSSNENRSTNAAKAATATAGALFLLQFPDQISKKTQVTDLNVFFNQPENEKQEHHAILADRTLL